MREWYWEYQANENHWYITLILADQMIAIESWHGIGFWQVSSFAFGPSWVLRMLPRIMSPITNHA